MARIFLERREMGEDLRRLFDLLDGESQAAGGTGEFTPPLDVIEVTSKGVDPPSNMSPVSCSIRMIYL